MTPEIRNRQPRRHSTHTHKLTTRRGHKVGNVAVELTQNSTALDARPVESCNIQRQEHILPPVDPPTTEVKPGWQEAHNSRKLMRIEVIYLFKGRRGLRCAPLSKKKKGSPLTS